MSELFPVSIDACARQQRVTQCPRPNELGFEIVLPPFLKDQSAGTLARFATDDSAGLCIDVSARPVLREFQPCDLTEAELEASGSRIVEKRTVVDPSGLRHLDVLYATHNGRFCRTMTFSDGNRLFDVTASSSREHYPTVAEDAFTSLTSFRLLNPTGGSFVESRRTCSVTRPAGIEFEYPESWDHIPVVHDDNLLAIELTSDYEGSITGKLRLEVHAMNASVSSTTIIRRYTEAMRDSGLCLSGAPVHRVPSLPGFDTTSICNLSATFDENQFDAPVLVAENSAATMILGLLGTSKNQAPTWWAINKRAFEIVRDSFIVKESHSTTMPNSIRTTI